MKRLLTESALLAVGLVASLVGPRAGLAAGIGSLDAFPGADLFTNGSVRQIEIQIPLAGMDSLRRDPREFVHATLNEHGVVYDDVAIHLKGSVGSFREVDDKPDLTLDFERFKTGRKFHELRRIHLNNSVEDPAYCNEMLGGELFRAAGIPAPRVAHAVVTLNGRRLGLYVLIEGFTEDFLGCYYKQIGGNLYEPADGHDVNQHLKRNSIEVLKHDRAALQALADATLETDLTKRWSRLERTLDVDEYVKFMAMEVMIGHRDGYSLARNNYRVYENVESGKMVFFPHGMDQLFGHPDATWLPHMAGLVAKSVMETTEGQLRYRATFASLFTNVFHAQKLQERVGEIVTGLRPAITDAEYAAIVDEAVQLKERIAQRQVCLKRQLSEPELTILAFTNGIGDLHGWVKVDDSKSVRMDQDEAASHIQSLHIVARSDSGASWRAQVLLGRGRYRFEGRVKVAGVAPLPYGKYEGAGLRVAGSLRESANVVGDSDWRALSEEFEVTEATREVELVCELRASAGEAWFAKESLRLVQIQ